MHRHVGLAKPFSNLLNLLHELSSITFFDKAMIRSVPMKTLCKRSSNLKLLLVKHGSVLLIRRHVSFLVISFLFESHYSFLKWLRIVISLHC
jgi:hypothetical protein